MYYSSRSYSQTPVSYPAQNPTDPKASTNGQYSQELSPAVNQDQVQYSPSPVASATGMASTSISNTSSPNQNVHPPQMANTNPSVAGYYPQYSNDVSSSPYYQQQEHNPYILPQNQMTPNSYYNHTFMQGQQNAPLPPPPPNHHQQMLNQAPFQNQQQQQWYFQQQQQQQKNAINPQFQNPYQMAPHFQQNVDSEYHSQNRMGQQNFQQRQNLSPHRASIAPQSMSYTSPQLAASNSNNSKASMPSLQTSYSPSFATKSNISIPSPARSSNTAAGGKSPESSNMLVQGYQPITPPINSENAPSNIIPSLPYISSSKSASYPSQTQTHNANSHGETSNSLNSQTLIESQRTQPQTPSSVINATQSESFNPNANQGSVPYEGYNKHYSSSMLQPDSAKPMQPNSSFLTEPSAATSIPPSSSNSSSQYLFTQSPDEATKQQHGDRHHDSVIGNGVTGHQRHHSNLRGDIIGLGGYHQSVIPPPSQQEDSALRLNNYNYVSTPDFPRHNNNNNNNNDITQQHQLKRTKSFFDETLDSQQYQNKKFKYDNGNILDHPQQQFNQSSTSNLESHANQQEQGSITGGGSSSNPNDVSLNNNSTTDDVNDDPKARIGSTQVDKMMLIIQAQQQIAEKVKKGEVQGPISLDDEKLLVPSKGILNGGVGKRQSTTSLKYKCTYPDCNKSFNQKTHLVIHGRSHTGDRPYVCTFEGCGKRFSQHGNLRTHRRSHTGDRPYQCEICGKTFAQCGNFRAHKLIHNNYKPFECKLDKCGKTFTQLGNLKAHQNKFHQESLNKLIEDFKLYATQIATGNTDSIPKEDLEMLQYFSELYKNSNRGIKGRGKESKYQTKKRNNSESGNESVSSVSSSIH